MSDWFTTPLPPAIEHPAVGKVAPVYWTPIPLSGERICIAVIGHDSAQAVGVALHRLRCLGEMGDSFTYFGTRLADDFRHHVEAGRSPEDWRPNLSGMTIGQWSEAHGDSLAACASAHIETFSALWKPDVGHDEKPAETLVVPRNKELRRFIQIIKTRVESVNKELTQLFYMHYSLADTQERIKSTVDYMSSRYAACYAVLNPKTQNTRLYAHDSLWRLARARDAQLVPPTLTESVLWVPDPELPMFNESDIANAKEHVAELQAEAEREEISVVTVHSAEMAARRLIAAEER